MRDNYWYQLSLEGCGDTLDFGHEGYVEHYTVFEPEDSTMDSDIYHVVHVDNQGFISVYECDDVSDLYENYKTHCETEDI